MRKLCPNFDREDGLYTVLEVPVPEETFASPKKNHSKSWQNMKSCMKTNGEKSPAPLLRSCNAEIQLLLGVFGAPSIPLPIRCDRIEKDHPLEASKEKYIVQQYVTAVGGEETLNSIDSMYSMGKVKKATSETYI